MKKAIVTGCDINYLPGAKALLRTVKSLHPDIARFCIVPPGDADAISRELGDLANIFIAPRPVRVIPDRMQPALLKLFSPLVPADVVVWMDCDMLMCKKSEEIFDVKKGEVIAVMDNASCIRDMILDSMHHLYERQFPGLIDRRGFNGGLFAFRASEWLDLAGRYERAFEDGGYPYHTKIWDQPFLNGLMYNNLKYIDIKLNFHNLFSYKIPRDVKILHFTNKVKPWMDNFPKHEPSYYYWLRYGLGIEGFRPLLGSRLRIWSRTPKRLVGKILRERWRFGGDPVDFRE